MSSQKKMGTDVQSPAFQLVENGLLKKPKVRKKAVYLELPENLVLVVDGIIADRLSRNEFFRLLIEDYIASKSAP